MRGWVKSGWKETDGVKLKGKSDSASATRWPELRDGLGTGAHAGRDVCLGAETEWKRD